MRPIPVSTVPPMNWPPPEVHRKSESLLSDLHGLTLVLVAGACLTGMFLASLVQPLPAVSMLIGGVPALIAVPLLWKDTRARIILLIVLSLLVGAWRYTFASPLGDPQAISSFIGRGKVEVQGCVTDEPAIQGKTRVLLIGVTSISLNAGTSWQDAHGELEVRTLDSTLEDPYGANYGDAVDVQGTVQPPTQYTATGVFADMSFPRISVMSSGGNPILAALYALRVRLATVIAQSLPQPEAALLIAILLSLRTTALKPLTNFFNETGTSHLIAPSGFKVTIIAGIMISSTRWLYKKPVVQPGQPGQQTWQMLPAERRQGAVRRWLVTTLVVICIIIYTILSGAGPAAIRAGIMGVIMVIAPRIGRIYNVYTALAFAALIMSMLNPFILWDVGFQLSFLGTLGIVMLAPPLQRLLSPLERVPFGHTIAEISAVTLAAQIATLPVMMLTFNQVSFIAPITNILTIPVLAMLLSVGLLLCGLGLLYAPLGVLCSWAALPLLRYVAFIVTWCAQPSWSHISVPSVNNGLAWGYYGLLALSISTLRYKWPAWLDSRQGKSHAPLFSKRAWRVAQCCAVLLVILATGATALATRANGQLTITFLSVGPASQPPQGEAILIQTPDGKTALIDGGLDATSLGQALDARLPIWQRSLDLVLLTTPRSDHLTGLQDIVSRYQIGEVADAGMLHPNTGYALWRRTIAERNIHYLQLHQGMTITVGTQVALQIFWPASPLHKSSDEERDNGLIVRLLTPNLRLLLLGVTASSNYALDGLLTGIAPIYLQADVVQVVAQTDKAFSSSLLAVIQAAHPSLLIITPASLTAKQRKAGATTAITVAPTLSTLVAQVVQTAQMGTLEVHCTDNGWSVTSD